MEREGKITPTEADELIERQKAAVAESEGRTVEDVEQSTKETVAAALPAEDQDWFSKLSEGLDLATFGMHLLANNDGNQNVGQALGRALAAARQYKTTQSRNAEKDVLDKRAVEADEKRAEASMITAIATRTRAALSGLEQKPPSKTELTNTQIKLSAFTGNSVDMDDALQASVVTSVTQLMKEADNKRRAGGQPPMTGAEQDQFIRDYFADPRNADLLTPDFWGSESTIDTDVVHSRAKGF
jgi:hypothetical protein